jgi:nucleotide-binding universal stress UspA family protein
LWIAEHRASLEKEWGTEIKTEVAVVDLLRQEAQESDSPLGRIGGKILEVIAPSILESGPPPGQWREEARLIHRDDRLFTDILVPVNGEASGWYALDQALVIAQREGARLHGLHVVDEENVQSEATQAVQSEFARRCQERGQAGHLLITSGEVARQISTQSRLTDLVVTTLLYPPPPQLLARIDSGFRELIQLCPRPVLAVPQVVTPLNHALLAYDGSPKSDEALFVATYMAGRWQIPLTVVTVFDQNRVAPETLMRARVYLEERNIQAEYAPEEGPVAEAILKTGDERQADVIIMGGYGFNPVLGMMLGSAVDQVLREARKPVLICR